MVTQFGSFYVRLSNAKWPHFRAFSGQRLWITPELWHHHFLKVWPKPSSKMKTTTIFVVRVNQKCNTCSARAFALLIHESAIEPGLCGQRNRAYVEPVLFSSWKCIFSTPFPVWPSARFRIMFWKQTVHLAFALAFLTKLAFYEFITEWHEVES